jgi:exoribonuclease-2
MRGKTFDLELLAKHILQEKGFQPEFSQAALRQLDAILAPAPPPPHAEDLTSLLWCSIDNDDSRDLDQLTYAQKRTDGRIAIWVAIADVDALVSKDSAIDQHAQINTTSIYTPARIFTMLPEKLSTDLTSLNENENRLAIVVKAIINSEGECEESAIFQALVCNRAQLTYNAIGAYLAGNSDVPEKVKQVEGLEQTLRCQHEAAQILKNKRHELGALTLETLEAEAKVTKEAEIVMRLSAHNYAHQLIEDFMIAANTTMARQFRSAKIPGLRRVVRIPKRWDRIIQIAALLGTTLPEQPNPQALDKFLTKQKQLNPETFPDLSLTIIKLLGRGEYVVEVPGDKPIGHFGLALSEYMHSTAPNRRFPDLISQRICKAYLRGGNPPYPLPDLISLAEHCTQQEDAAMKIERRLNKSAAAMLLSHKIGAVFSGIVTGTGPKGTWVRILDPPVEGKVIHGDHGLDVGDKVSVKLIGVDIPNGYIDFSV